ncbi:hypothetical protein D8B26_002685 [Coccidioides posadasii str. Silveira]|uniref:Leucine-rich repeat domain-containing protein n=1 Tax=Coccidioides posadasii RMSCC 3488 TaxID=454284 RepID=A0A0J6FBU8_COCPO|nr:hypothetical protein CPAG_03073 [Coccidioides posadasii RMSCC 3488]QVM07990.1 hypothetical protein D8B26_002685 [Coccidioides posadasii str. Silveira]
MTNIIPNHTTRRLDTFPLEILMLIAEELNESEDQFAFMLCCRQFHAITEPLFYKSIDLGPYISKRSIRTLLRTLLERPSLADHIRELQLFLWDSDGAYVGPVTLSSRPAREEILSRPRLHRRYALLEKKITFASRSQDEEWEWLEDIRAGVVDAFLAVLLILVPNLENLKMTQFPPNSNHFFKTIFRAARRSEPFDEHPILTRLSFVDIMPHFANCVGPCILLPYIGLPALKTLVTSKLGEDWLNRGQWADSSLTTLKVTQSCCSASIATFLESCKSLKVFKYSHHNEFGPQRFNIMGIWKSLQVTKDTLEDLWLDVERGRDIFEPSWPTEVPFSFAEFRALKVIGITTRQILDLQNPDSHALVDILPPNLEGLTLLDMPDEHLEYITSEVTRFVKASPTVAPSLTKIALCGNFNSDAVDTLESVAKVREACSETGVELSFPMEW